MSRRTEATLEGLGRDELLERLAYWNSRLETLGSAPIVNAADAHDLTDVRLRRVVDGTIGRVVELLESRA